MSEQRTNSVRLSVVLPTFNQETRIGATVAAVAAFLASKPYGSEIVVVDDGSSDRTAEAARAALGALGGRPASKVLRRDENLGKGASVREGVLAAAGEIVLFADDDLSTPIEEADKLVAAIEAGADAAIGSRALAASEIRVRQAPAARGDGQALQPACPAAGHPGLPRHPMRLQGLPEGGGPGDLLAAPDRGLRLRRRGRWSSAASWAIAWPKSRSSGAIRGRAASGSSEAPGACSGSCCASAASTAAGGARTGINALWAWPGRCSRSCWQLRKRSCPRPRRSRRSRRGSSARAGCPSIPGSPVLRRPGFSSGDRAPARRSSNGRSFRTGNRASGRWGTSRAYRENSRLGRR